MERLTHYETPEKHAYVDRGLVSLGWYSMTDEGFRGPAIERLAAYEDTGLAPEEIKTMHNEPCVYCAEDTDEVCLNKGNIVWCEDGPCHGDCGYFERAPFCRRCGRPLAHQDAGQEPSAAAQLKQIAEIFNCDPNDPAQLKQLCDKLRVWQQAEQDGRLVVANVSGRCGSCVHYRRIEGTARGACLKHPYGKDVICDPKNPYWVVGRSRLKCKLYEEAN